MKPCPFCGGEAEVRSELWSQFVVPGTGIIAGDEAGIESKYRVRCKGCGCGTPLSSESEWAKADWNRRVTPKTVVIQTDPSTIHAFADFLESRKDSDAD